MDLLGVGRRPLCLFESKHSKVDITYCVPDTLPGLGFAPCAQHNTEHLVQYNGHVKFVAAYK